MTPTEKTEVYDSDEHEFTFGAAFSPKEHWNAAIEVGYSWVPNNKDGTVTVLAANTGYTFNDNCSSGVSFTYKFNNNLDVYITEWVNIYTREDLFKIEGFNLDAQFNFGFVNEKDNGETNDYTFLVTGIDLKYEINDNLETFIGPRFSWNNDDSPNNIENSENHLWLGLGITSNF